MQRIWLSLFMILLTACAQTTPPYPTPQTWQGQDLKTLVALKGSPTAIIALPNGLTDYIYYQTSVTFPPSSPPPVAVNMSRSGKPVLIPSQPTVTTPPQVIVCATRFTLNTHQVIVKVSQSGNQCH